MLTTNSKIVRAKAQHLVDRFWFSSVAGLDDYDTAKHCAIISVEEMYNGSDKDQLIHEIMQL